MVEIFEKASNATHCHKNAKQNLLMTVVMKRFLTLSGLENFVRTNTYVSMNLIVRGYVYL